jgi:hypothetical protein
MLDPQVLRNRLDEVTAALKPRGFDLDTATLERLETRRKAASDRDAGPTTPP